MPLPDIDIVLDWRGRTVVDRAGEKIGKLGDIYLDEDTDRPEWAAIHIGLFGVRKTLVPLTEARAAGDDVEIPFDKAHVKSAPKVDPKDALSQEEEAKLYEHYGLDYARSESDTGLPQGAGGAAHAAESRSASGERAEGAAREGEAASPAAGAQAGEHDLTRSEEPMEVGTEAGPRERVRLRKYVVTERVTKTVPVSREEVRVEREPIDQGQGTEAADAGEEGPATEQRPGSG